MKRLIISFILVGLTFINQPLNNKGVLMNTDAYEQLQQFSLELSTDYGHLSLRWEKPDVITGNDSYKVILQGYQDGKWNDLHETYAMTTYYDGRDLNAYCAQENGFKEKCRFIVEGYDNDVLVCYGISDEYDPRDFFPEVDELVIGKDINADDINYVSYTQSGTTADSIMSYTVTKDEDEYLLYYGDKEKKITKAQWDNVIELVKQGTVVRDYIMDPELVVLDGETRRYRIEWEDITDLESNYYSLRMKDKSLLEYFQKLEKGGIDIATIGIGAAAIIGAASIALLKKKK